jgi:hypothetical protein
VNEHRCECARQDHGAAVRLDQSDVVRHRPVLPATPPSMRAIAPFASECQNIQWSGDSSQPTRLCRYPRARARRTGARRLDLAVHHLASGAQGRRARGPGPTGTW